MVQAEFLEAGRIDDGTVRAQFVELVQARKGRRVLARVERGRDFAHGDVRVRHQQVDQRRLAHARLADQDRRLARQQGRQGGHGMLGFGARRHFIDGIAHRGIRQQAFAGAFQRSGHVRFVEDDARFDAGRVGRHQRARDQVVGKARLRRHDDEQLRQIGGQQFRFVLVRAVQQGLAFLDAVDDGLVVRGARQVHDVAHGHIGFLAARHALQFGAVHVGQIVAAVGGDDDARQLAFAHAVTWLLW
ncbi:hypothetical protein D3C72_1656320 [compost metagenome]